MTIHDINYLKDNSEKKCEKIHMHCGSSELDTLFQNVYCIHILSVFTDEPIDRPLTLNLYANDTRMDSILVHSQGHIDNSIGESYENNVHPLAKLSYIEFRQMEFNESNSKFDTPVNKDIFVTFAIRYYNPVRMFNDKFIDLNPEYDPHFIPEESDSEPDSEY